MMKIILHQDSDISVQRGNMTYRDIIQNQRENLPRNRNWWPKYFYHFTDIQNALGIIDKGWIFARQKAIDDELMQNDNASKTVISVSDNHIKEYARLYFRPKTPTQFHNEGYKPESVRQTDINASCPVPVFFFLDSEYILNMESVKFSEVSCAGYGDLCLMSGEKAFSNLPFEKIFHDGYFDAQNRDDIVSHRHAEIVRPLGIPIKNCLKGIVCRSVAERQTLLYILRNQYFDKYKEYRHLIKYDPTLDMFFNNGIFIREVRYNGELTVMLNDASKRKSYSKNNSIVNCLVVIDYLDNNGDIFGRDNYNLPVDYLKAEEININVPSDFSGSAIVEVYFDDILMYKNIMDMSMENLL